uniref:Uncharacterized protein n=1 Tax=Glossina austeni TaxID=7395 RepID=A0A1A9VGV8_GLOAU
MKLTICQFSKLFLLLTAFFYILDQCNVLPASAIVTIKAETVSIVYDEDDDKNNDNNDKDIKKFAKAKELYSSEIFRNLENSLETTATRTTTTRTLVNKLEDTLTKDEVSSLMKTLDNKQEQQQQQPEQQKQRKQISATITTNERIAKDLNVGKSIEKLSKHTQSLYVRLKGGINKNENKKNNNKNDNDNHNDSSNDYYNIDKNDDENNNNNNNNDEDENVNAKDNKASDVHSMTAAAGIDLKILSAHKLTTLVRDVENQQHFMASKQKATTKTTIIPSSTIILSNDFIRQKSKKQQQEQAQYKLRSSPTPLPAPSPAPSLSSLASTLMPANEITSTSTTSASSSDSRQNLPSSSMLHSNTNRISGNSGYGSRSYRHTANTIKLQRQHQQEQKEQQVEREHQRQHQQQQQQQQHKYQHQLEQRVGVLVSSALLNRMHVQQGFRNFMEFFQVNFKNVTVDFLLDDDDGCIENQSNRKAKRDVLRFTNSKHLCYGFYITWHKITCSLTIEKSIWFSDNTGLHMPAVTILASSES